MTVKQFAYLLVGAILAWIAFSLPIFFLFKLPLALLFALTGIVFAFVPIQGRPADTMALLFIKALFHPNEYAKQQKDKETTVTSDAIQETLQQKKPPEEKKQTVFFESHPPLITPSSQVAPTPEQEHEVFQAPEQSGAAETDLLEHKEQTEHMDALAKELASAKAQEQQAMKGSEDALAAHQKVAELQAQMQELLSQKQELEKQLIELRQQLEKKPRKIFTPSLASEAPMQTTHVKRVPQPLTKTVGAPFTPDVPNVITGVVTDSRGNVLPNILVEVKDKDDNPVRAFKTNSLGQFASATPLLNGTYTLTFEDPKKQQNFDTVELVADGSILQPLEVISTDQRELLRKELFSS